MGSTDKVVQVWELDPDALLASSSSADDTRVSNLHHATAKIVLLGNSGVGKTGLGWRLAHGEFKEHASTHGQQFWIVDEMATRRADGTACEAVLWDLAGQPDYRLIHALFLEDADLALVLFDPTHTGDPLGGAEYWLEQLPEGCRTILVAARVDRGSPVLTEEELERFCRQKGVRGGFVLTSAREGSGLSDLVARMHEQIDWDAKPATTTTQTFKRIKDFVLDLKEGRGRRRVVLAPEELRRRLRKSDDDWAFSREEMMAAVGRLASHGYVRVIRTSKGEERILLVPELLNNLAASFVLEARRNPKGLGALEEARVLSGDYPFPELRSLQAADRELLLDATSVAFLENRLSYRCFREILGETRLLVFPELMNLQKPPEDDRPVEDDVSYTVRGATENTFASLVVLLGYTNTFRRTDQWRDQARYEFEDGLICGFRRAEDRGAELDLVLFYGPNVGASVRRLFQGLFESFLSRRRLKVLRFEQLECSDCTEPLDRGVMRERLREGKDFAFCNECGARLALPSAVDPVQLTRGARRTVERQSSVADQRTIFEQAAFQLHRFVEAAEGIERPSCFVSYAWGDPEQERWVEVLVEDLEKGGLRVLFDRKDNASFGASIPRFVDRIQECARVLVVGTPRYLQKFENRRSEAGTVVAAEMDQISDRLLGTERAKESVIPLLLSGNESASLPPALRRRVYADFRSAGSYFHTLFQLLCSLYGIPSRDPAVRLWLQRLQLWEDPREEAEDEDGFSRRGLRRALPAVGETARRRAGEAGQPYAVHRDGRMVWIHPDGSERVAEPPASYGPPDPDEPSS